MTHKHNHQECIEKAFIHANTICADKGVRFTPLRKRVLELLWNNHKPAKAYDLLDVLREEDKSAKPSTIYRTLEFLQEIGLVHKVDSLNAYVGCTRPEAGRNCQFMICTTCGNINESSDKAVFTAIRQNAEKCGFVVERQIIEIHGICQECQPAH